MFENKKAQIDKELEISIPLENFSYSGAENDHCRQNGLLRFFGRTKEKSRFFGRAKEKSRLLDRLRKGKCRGGSFLVAGYRGAGKTRFVSEVLCDYKNENNNFIEVKVNLGNDGDLTSKSVLFNMVYLLNNALRKKRLVKYLEFLFGGIFRSLFLLSFLLVTFFSPALFFSTSSHIISLLNSFFNGGGNLLLLLIILLLMSMYSGKPRYFFSTWKAFLRLKKLQQQIYSTIYSHAEIKSNFWGFGKKRVTEPLTTNQIEVHLKDILEILKDKDVIFIFDELDKLSGRASDKADGNIDSVKESKLRKQQVDSILGDLKNLITSSSARYIFVAGRDMYDAYLSERGSSNSLYESLFNDHIYIPSLLTDRSDGEIYLLDSMIEAFLVSNLIKRTSINNTLNKIEANCEKKYRSRKESSKQNMSCERDVDLSRLKLSDYVDFKRDKNKKYIWRERKNLIYEEWINRKRLKEQADKLIREIYILKTLIHFLALHSWGNCKRLFTLFESFVRERGNKYELYFSTRDIQRLVLSSQLYIMFHHNLSRMLMNADDKLVVSSFSIFHYILKYHGIGFSREHILRMYETINIHSSPELTRIVDIIIHNVLLNHIRRVRNSFYQYRFTFLYEKEIHFITTINDGESAVFNFSLNAMDAVKQHYKSLIIESKQTSTDEEYGRATLASIHVIVGNFHFWEQSFDEASIHYGIALDMLEKNGGLTLDPAKVDLALQMIEIYLKQGSAAERVNDYLTAAAIYLNAETLANNCLDKLGNKVNRSDSKWDILKQPKWAKRFLNLKHSAIHYKNDFSTVSEIDGTDVSMYRGAVLSFFMENFSKARETFLNVITYPGIKEDTERTYSLIGNAYLKAGFSILLEFSSRLHKKLKLAESEHQDIDLLKKLLRELICGIHQAFDGMGNFVLLGEGELAIELQNKIKGDESPRMGEMQQILRLLNLSALSFEKGRLYSNAAISYLSMVMIWEAFLEALPWKKGGNTGNTQSGKNSTNMDWYDLLDNESKEKYLEIRSVLKKIRIYKEYKKNWIFGAQQRAFDRIGINTGEAYHHFMKSVLERNLKNRKLKQDSFFAKEIQRGRVLENNELLFQQYSLFGQIIAASIYWEEIAVNNVIGIRKKCAAKKSRKLILLKPDDGKNHLLPYGIKHYSIMLWLKGRMYLSEMFRLKENFIHEMQSFTHFQSVFDQTDKEKLREWIEELEKTATNAIVNFYRSSQYVIKTHGEASNMILPPLFIVYYNIWEVLYEMVACGYEKSILENEKPSSFNEAVYTVRFNLGSRLKKNDVKDVSSRVLDLLAVEQMAIEQYKIVERIGDLSSSDRTSILRNKHYLDDDYEDNMFILDWSYCRFFAPSAMVHGGIIKYKMEQLRKKFGERMEIHNSKHLTV